MAKGFKHGAGGSNPLNFKVICNPKPETAKENTIWVDTDRINRFFFSATEPETLEAYDVWFYVDKTSNIAFNALKKNGIQVYPFSAKQYVDGEWVGKTAKIYQSGEWIECWNGYYFQAGLGSQIGAWTPLRQSGSTSGNAVHVGNDQILFDTNSQMYNSIAVQSPLVDLSSVDTLSFDVQFSQSVARVGISSTKYGTSDSIAFAAYAGANGSRRTIDLDVSNYDGKYYITALTQQPGSGAIYNVWRKIG